MGVEASIEKVGGRRMGRRTYSVIQDSLSGGGLSIPIEIQSKKMSISE